MLKDLESLSVLPPQNGDHPASLKENNFYQKTLQKPRSSKLSAKIWKSETYRKPTNQKEPNRNKNALEVIKKY